MQECRGLGDVDGARRQGRPPRSLQEGGREPVAVAAWPWRRGGGGVGRGAAPTEHSLRAAGGPFSLSLVSSPFLPAPRSPSQSRQLGRPPSLAPYVLFPPPRHRHHHETTEPHQEAARPRPPRRPLTGRARSDPWALGPGFLRTRVQSGCGTSPGFTRDTRVPPPCLPSSHRSTEDSAAVRGPGTARTAGARLGRCGHRSLRAVGVSPSRSMSPFVACPPLLAQAPREAVKSLHSFSARFRGLAFISEETRLAHGHVMKLHKYTPSRESNLLLLFITGRRPV